MKLIKIIFVLFPVFSLYFFASVGEMYAETVTAESCSNIDVQTAINGASTGDTVIVPDGSCTWSSALTVTKAIIIKGAGIGQTIITGNVAGATKGIIKYAPASPNVTNQFRITGFTLDADGRGNGVYVTNTSATPEYIRIDHNRIINSNGGSQRCIYTIGTVFGVIDNNLIENCYHGVDSYGSSDTQWANISRDYGTMNNLYIEDNTFIPTGNQVMSASGQGGRYALRYNTLSPENVSSNFSPIIDMHGNQWTGGDEGAGNYGTMINEVYGNDINISPFGAGKIFDQRGGQTMAFYNKLTNGVNSATYVREEFSDDQWPGGNSFVQHVTNTYYWSNYSTKQGLIALNLDTENCCKNSVAWVPENVYATNYCANLTNDSNGNCWKHLKSLGSPPYTTSTAGNEPDWANTAVGTHLDDNLAGWLNMGTNSTSLVINEDYWTQSTTGAFDGTGDAGSGGGIGCGTLGVRPATCTIGVGYWATDQSCTDLTGMVGENPATPISGTFYKCTSTNTWTAYYTPYTYPHPLTIPPASPQNAR